MGGMNPWGIGLGPVFAFERTLSSRRWQSYAGRSCFVAGVLIALVAVRVSTSAPAGTSFRELAQMAELFFLAVSGTQLALVLLAAPAATAGAICLDRARGTLSHMLMTDLTNAEIVLGKLAARLVPVLCLLLCMLPVMELISLLGGVDSTALLGSFAVALGVAVLGCSLAMFFSIWVGKTHEALMGTYAIWALWLLAVPISDLVARWTGASWYVPPRTVDPFSLALAPYWWPNSVAASDYWWFLGVTFSVSALLVGVSALRVRAVCLREKVAKRPRRGYLDRIHGARRVLFGRLPWLSPSLDGNPVLWREWHRSRPSRFSLVVMGLFGGVSLFCSGIVIISPGGQACAWVNGFQVSIGLLFVSVAAASSLGEERARGSLDLLLTTPLSTREIVLGKWMGAYRMVPLLAILPALVIARGASLHDWKLLWVSLLSIAYVLSAGAAITSLGIAMATLISRLGRAVGATVVLYVLVAAGWLMLMALILTGPSSLGLAMASPFLWAGQMAFDVTNRPDDTIVGWAIFWTIACALVGFWLLRFTLAEFDRRLGRAQATSTGMTPVSALLTKSYPWAVLGLVIVGFNPTWALAMIAVLFTLGLFRHSVTAANWSGGDQGEADRNDLRRRVIRPSQAVLVWLDTACCDLLPVIAPSLIVVIFHSPREAFWNRFLVTVIYMSAISAAFICLAAAIATPRRRRGSTIAIVAAAWALANGGWLAVSAALGGRSWWPGLALGMGSPFLGVLSLASGIMDTPAFHEGELAWALVWSVIYALCAVLLRTARKQIGGVAAEMIPRPAFRELLTFDT